MLSNGQALDLLQVILHSIELIRVASSTVLVPVARTGELIHRLDLATGEPIAAPVPEPEQQPEPVVEEEKPRKGKRKGRKGKRKKKRKRKAAE